MAGNGKHQQATTAWAQLCKGRQQLVEVVEALELLAQRQPDVDNSVYYDVLKRCISERDLALGTRVHAIAVKNGFESDAFLANHIICMYGSNGRLKEAMQVFTKVARPDRYMWASIILVHARQGAPVEAIALYKRLRRTKLKPNNHVFVAALKSCAAAKDLHSGRQVHADICEAPGQPDIFVCNALVDMYAKCRSIDDARAVFDRLPRKNVVTWTAMIDGYAQHGLGQEALALYASMQQEGSSLQPNRVTFLCVLQACATSKCLDQGKQVHAQILERGLENDMVVGNCLVHMYAKCGSLEDARQVFDSLSTKDLVTWTAMISGYAQHGFGQEALALHALMQQQDGMAPVDAMAVVSLLQACGSVAGLEKGKEFHAQVSRLGFSSTDLFVANALIDMYSRCGSMVDAQQVFYNLSTTDVVTWNALIAGYARQGDGESVFRLLQQMINEGLAPDSVTFVSVLNVCSHLGLVDAAQGYFRSMCVDHNISPTIEHYTCMVDLFGRAGQVDKALDMVKSMPFQADSAVWSSLLSASLKWNNVELGRQAFEFAVSAHSSDAPSYVSMSNIYSAAEMHKHANDIQALRLQVQAWKDPGWSCWTDSDGYVHTFLAGGSEHPRWKDIDVQLKDVLVKMKGEECVAWIESTKTHA